MFHPHGSTVAAGRRAFHFPGRRIDERFTRKGSYFFFVAWLAFVRAAQLGSARGGSQARPLAKFGAPPVWLGVSWEPGRPVLFLKWVFYVDESTPFEESRRFTSMGAPLRKAAGPFISRAAELMSVLPAREATFFVPPGLRLFGLPSWARQGAASGVTPEDIKERRVVFCVSGSILTTESESFT